MSSSRRFLSGGMFGADVAVLIKILAEDIQRFQQLKMMIQQSKDQGDYLRMINSGIENSIGLLQALPVKDEKILAELRDFQGAMNSVSNVYGVVPQSPEATMQTLLMS